MEPPAAQIERRRMSRIVLLHNVWLASGGLLLRLATNGGQDVDGIFFSMTIEYRVFAVVAVKGKQPDQFWPLIDYNTVLDGTSKAVYVLFI